MTPTRGNERSPASDDVVRTTHAEGTASDPGWISSARLSLTNTEAGLTRTAAATPEQPTELGPYLDFLKDTGRSDRAECVERIAAAPPAARHALWEQNEELLMGSLHERVSPEHCTIRDGLVRELRISATDLLSSAALNHAFTVDHPIERISVEVTNPTDLARIVALRQLRQVPVVELVLPLHTAAEHLGRMLIAAEENLGDSRIVLTGAGSAGLGTSLLGPLLRHTQYRRASDASGERLMQAYPDAIPEPIYPNPPEDQAAAVFAQTLAAIEDLERRFPSNGEPPEEQPQAPITYRSAGGESPLDAVAAFPQLQGRHIAHIRRALIADGMSEAELTEPATSISNATYHKLLSGIVGGTYSRFIDECERVDRIRANQVVIEKEPHR